MEKPEKCVSSFTRQNSHDLIDPVSVQDGQKELKVEEYTRKSHATCETKLTLIS